MRGGDTESDLARGATVDEHVGRPAVGDVPPWLGERYRVLRLLGRGGMGEVYLAFDEALLAEVALKTIDAGAGDALARLRDEVRHAQKVTHPNVCRTYDLEEIDGNWLVKMEHVAGQTLAERLKEGPLPVAEAVAVATQVCAGLAAAHHQGVVHRDLKPHNIMIEGKTGRVVLMDFGIARAAALAGKSAENVSGTPEYMAPEQVRGREVDGRADLYSLGCVLHEMLTGERVFPRATAMAAALAHVNDPPPLLPASMPKRVARVVARLLEKDPARRPADADEVAALLTGPQRRRAWWVAAAAVIVAAVGVALITTRPARRWQPQIRQLPVYDENGNAPALSPDGKQYAVTSDREERGRFRVYVGALDGGPQRAITAREISAKDVRWQRDGKGLLVTETRPPARLLRYAVEGGAPEVIAEGVLEAEDCAGRLLLLLVAGAPGCGQCKRLALRDADGQERDLLHIAATARLHRPNCDRLGRRVVYSYRDFTEKRPETGDSLLNPGVDLWLLALDGGSPRRLTSDNGRNFGSFTPDGGSIVYSGRGGHLWELSLEGGRAPVQITFGQGWEIAPDVSSDGRLVLYQVDVVWAQLNEQPLEGGSAHRLTTAPMQLSNFHATPDGGAIIAQAQLTGMVRPMIVVIPLDGGDPAPLVDGEIPGLTLDGTEILYTMSGSGRVLAIPRAGGTPRPVTEVAGRVLDLEAGPDGRVHMRVARPQGEEAWSAPLAGGAAERELPAPWSVLRPAPRGGWRVAQESDMSGVRLRFLAPGMQLDDPAARELRTGHSGTWMPDGLSWLHRRYVNTLARYFVETGEDRVLLHTGEIGSVAVSPDGKTVYTMQIVAHLRRELITNFADRPRP